MALPGIRRLVLGCLTWRVVMSVCAEDGETDLMADRFGRALFAGCLFLAVVVAGCGVPQDSATDSDVSRAAAPSEVAGMPPNLNIAFRWVSGDALDLMNAEGTFVRAYTESFELASEGQSAEWGYPGFVEASPADIDEQVKSVMGNSFNRKVVSTVFYRPLRRVDSGTTSRLILCRSESLSIEQRSPSPDSVWRKIGKPWGYTIIIEFTRSANGRPPAKQEGARRAPSHSVFGNWHVTFYDRLGMGPENRADTVACDALPPNPDLPAVGVEMGPEPWPTLPPSPGWPASGV